MQRSFLKHSSWTSCLWCTSRATAVPFSSTQPADSNCASQMPPNWVSSSPCSTCYSPGRSTSLSPFFFCQLPDRNVWSQLCVPQPRLSSSRFCDIDVHYDIPHYVPPPHRRGFKPATPRTALDYRASLLVWGSDVCIRIPDLEFGQRLLFQHYALEAGCRVACRFPSRG